MRGHLANPGNSSSSPRSRPFCVVLGSNIYFIYGVTSFIATSFTYGVKSFLATSFIYGVTSFIFPNIFYIWCGKFYILYQVLCIY